MLTSAPLRMVQNAARMVSGMPQFITLSWRDFATKYRFWTRHLPVTHFGAVAEHEGEELGVGERVGWCHDEGGFERQFVELRHGGLGVEREGEHAAAVAHVCEVEAAARRSELRRGTADAW